MVRPANAHGVLALDKPPGMTSHDVVARCRKVFGQRQVGHAGTLDPDATGVLILGLGNATRLLRYLSESRKTYRGVIEFGTATDTLDAAGTVVATSDVRVQAEALRDICSVFTGAIEQVPPMVSALKIDGKRLHELAREGIEVERKARPVTIHSLVVESPTLTSDLENEVQRATIVVDCSSGTYIRTLAADIGTALGTVAHLANLRRLSVGAFGIDETVTLDALCASEQAEQFVMAPAAALRMMPVVVASHEQRAKIRNGATFAAGELLGDAGLDSHPGPFAVHDAVGELVAVYERRGAGVKPALVLATPDRK